jgi:hypothetical protein
MGVLYGKKPDVGASSFSLLQNQETQGFLVTLFRHSPYFILFVGFQALLFPVLHFAH